MRTLLTSAFFCIALTPALDACCCDEPPTTLKFANIPPYSIQRGDYLVFMGDHLSVADLKRGKIFELGKVEGRWFDIDVKDGQALILKKERLQVITLENKKIVHDIDVGKERVYSFGFIGTDRAFVHRGRKLDIVELASGKTLHTIDFGSDEMRWGSGAWQIVGKRLFIAGPQTSVCVID